MDLVLSIWIATLFLVVDGQIQPAVMGAILIKENFSEESINNLGPYMGLHFQGFKIMIDLLSKDMPTVYVLILLYILACHSVDLLVYDLIIISQSFLLAH